jgi:hypothetical protein
VSVKRRLVKLKAEAEAARLTETADEREKRLAMIREGAEQQNGRWCFREPPFVIADDGTVSCSRDGRPVTTYPATIAEVWFWEEMERGEDEGLRLVYDEETEAFYNRAGEFALSRDFADLRGLMGPNSG